MSVGNAVEYRREPIDADLEPEPGELHLRAHGDSG
jgi:hypothetical protein